MAPPRRLRPSQLLAALIRPLDPVLLMIVGCLMLYSIIIIWSAAPGRLSQHITVNITISLIGMWIVALIPLRRLLSLSPLFYIAGVVLLIAVHLFGSVSKGAQRWLEIGFSQRIQPSELMKIAMPMALAWFFQKREHNINWWGFLVAFLLLSVPVYLIAKQPDLGTAILISTSGLYVIFFAGLPWKLILPILIAGFAAVIAFSVYGDQICQEGIRWPVLKPYQQDRVCTMLDPTRDRKGKGFHIIQSTIAIGSGGISGKGWKHGTQTQLDFLPERHTDFAFSVLAEEFGFFGGLILLGLYLALLVRGFFIAGMAPTLAGRLLAGSITMTFFTYIFVNIGMVSGILPVVGIPLPFISFGGTAVVALSLAIGILMGIRRSSLER